MASHLLYIRKIAEVWDAVGGKEEIEKFHCASRGLGLLIADFFSLGEFGMGKGGGVQLRADGPAPFVESRPSFYKGPALSKDRPGLQRPTLGDSPVSPS